MSESTTEQLEQRLAAAEARLTVLEAGAGTVAAAVPNPWPAEAFDRHAEPPRRRVGRTQAAPKVQDPVAPRTGPQATHRVEETPTGQIRRQRAADPFYGA